AADRPFGPRAVRGSRPREHGDARYLYGWSLRLGRLLGRHRVPRDGRAVGACRGGRASPCFVACGAAREAHPARPRRGVDRSVPLGSEGVSSGCFLLSRDLGLAPGGARSHAGGRCVEVPHRDRVTLGVHRLAEKLEERDATLSGHLWASALCMSSRIARASAFPNRRMFASCVDRTLSALSEISYYLDMGYAMGLISKEDHQEIESLGGRALFYSMKLVMSLAGGSPDETA